MTVGGDQPSMVRRWSGRLAGSALLAGLALCFAGSACTRERAGKKVDAAAAADPAHNARPVPPGTAGGAAPPLAGLEARAEAGAVATVLPAEEREAHPESEIVTVKILVEPPHRARVYWGAKDLGLAPLEIQRPRGSGPLDLVLKAPGYLTLHTRAFTDRNDKISVRLVPEADAPQTFGYRAR